MTLAECKLLALEDGYERVKTLAGWQDLRTWNGPECDWWSYRPPREPQELFAADRFRCDRFVPEPGATRE
jgi:hypothetical protein